MSLLNASFMPRVLFAPGGQYTARNFYNRRQFEGLAFSRMPDGALHFYPDARRLRVPQTSIAWLLEDAETETAIEPPATKWQLTTVTFRNEVHVGGSRMSISYWEASKYPEIGCVETDHGVRLELPDRRFANIPWNAIATLADRPTAETVAPAPRQDWPAAEVTPSAPPRRPPPRKP